MAYEGRLRELSLFSLEKRCLWEINSKLSVTWRWLWSQTVHSGVWQENEAIPQEVNQERFRLNIRGEKNTTKIVKHWYQLGYVSFKVFKIWMDKYLKNVV